MTDVWLRFTATIVTQLVILAGLYWNRRQNRKESRERPAQGRALSLTERQTIIRIEKKIDDLNKAMLRHLQSHSANARGRG